MTPFSLTVDGFERQFAVNHLAHFSPKFCFQLLLPAALPTSTLVLQLSLRAPIASAPSASTTSTSASPNLTTPFCPTPNPRFPPSGSPTTSTGSTDQRGFTPTRSIQVASGLDCRSIRLLRPLRARRQTTWSSHTSCRRSRGPQRPSGRLWPRYGRERGSSTSPTVRLVLLRQGTMLCLMEGSLSMRTIPGERIVCGRSVLSLLGL